LHRNDKKSIAGRTLSVATRECCQRNKK